MLGRKNPAAAAFVSPTLVTGQLSVWSPSPLTSTFAPSVTQRCRNCQPTPTRSAPLTMTAFRKYHGLGNDFVLIDNRNAEAPILTPAESTAICDRHTGVGADGVIFLLPSGNAESDIGMRLYNSDGTEPEMCGNGIRCLARFAADLSVPSRSEGKFVVDTLAGPIIPELLPSSGHVRVDMGPPTLTAADIPTTLHTTAENCYTAEITNVANQNWAATCVSMGNPHAIIFVDEATYKHLDENLESIGPSFESHEVFPQRTNTEFVRARSETEFDMVVWERGAGRTQACGTGACAVVVAAVLTGRARKDVAAVVHLPGGDLTIEWESATNHVQMTGPAELVFEGQIANM